MGTTTQPFKITKLVDDASPELMQYLLDGTEFNATLDVLHFDPDSGERVIRFIWILENARVKSIQSGPIQTSVAGGYDGEPPTEEVTFVFGYIQWSSPDQNFTIEMKGNFPLNDNPSDTDDDGDDIVFLRPEHNPLTPGAPTLEEQIPLISWNWGISADIPPKGLKMSESSAYEPFTITKEIDKNSPIFYELMTSGETINVTIEYHSSAESGIRHNATAFWRVMYSNNNIASIRIIERGRDTDGAGDPIPVEEITFNWGIMNWTWVEDGSSYEVTREELDPSATDIVEDTLIMVDFEALPDDDGNLGQGNFVDFMDIPVYEFHHELSQDIDLTNGKPLGNSSHSYVEVTKDVDQSSPLLLQSLLSGKTFQMTIRFYRIKFERPSPGSEPVLEEYKTIVLTNASVESITTFDGNMDNAHKEREHIAYCYQTINWDFWDGGISASDDWETPVA